MLEFYLADEAATVAAGSALAVALSALPPERTAFVVYLQGDLGAGKTTFSRGVLRCLGHLGNVKSPTYTLVEPYALACGEVYHFDLYRLKDPEELEYLGAESYFQQGLLCLVEWPQQGESFIPEADLTIKLAASATGRQLQLEAVTDRGKKLFQAFSLSVK